MEKTALYRFYDRDNNLLYVGISKDWLFRLETHKKDKSWIQEVANVKIAWYTTRINAELAERSAIRWESPKYNKQSVILNSHAWEHFEAIRSPEGLDHFHAQLYKRTNEYVDQAFPLDCDYGNIVEWAMCESLHELSKDPEEVVLECLECMKIANSWWLVEGHGIVCDAYIGANK
jgi:predicted GIY-YIG superfamily endonuclease